MLLDYNILRYTNSCNAPLKEALRQFDREKLRFLMCIDLEGRLYGVLTPGDVTRWLIADGNHSLDIELGEVCYRNPKVAPQGVEPAEVNRLLEHVAYVPVLDTDGRPVALAMRRHLQSGIQIGKHRISNGSPTFVIAEIGNNHNGSLDLAKRLIDLAKEAGADCAKFQMRVISLLYANAGDGDDVRENLGSQYTLDLLRKFQLSPDELFKAFDYCRNVGLEPLCTPWDEASVRHLEEYGLAAYKVASADMTNHHLLKVLASIGKPLICSTGMSRENEIRKMVDLLKHSGTHYVLLHCNSTYPAPFKDVHLSYMDRLKELGDCLVGYSSHERDIFVPVAAVALGAKVIEKHFTVDCSMEGNDHRVSLLPEEFSRMVEGIRQVEVAMGSRGPRHLTQGEMINRVTLAKSVFINCDIEAGTPIEAHMLEVKSPGQGLQPNQMTELIGQSAQRSMKTGDVFYLADLKKLRLKTKKFSFNSHWGLPVRHHDFQKLLKAMNPELLEFHLSYKDLNLNHSTFFPEPVPARLIVHAPELFEEDHILDLTTPDEEYRKRSLFEMRRVIDIAKALSKHFRTVDEPIGIVTNIGGFSQNTPLGPQERRERMEILKRSLTELRDKAVEVWPQTMPPFPWHFGGQRFHNLFVKAEEIVSFCEETGMRVCLDISHSKLACNHAHTSFQWFLEQVLPYTVHLHLADAKGVDGEGLQIGEGDVDFYALVENMRRYAPWASWIPEIWQGHENHGEGFWISLERLESYGI